jgi:hypothetical protein
MAAFSAVPQTRLRTQEDSAITRGAAQLDEGEPAQVLGNAVGILGQEEDEGCAGSMHSGKHLGWR